MNHLQELLCETAQNITLVAWPMIYGSENPYDQDSKTVLEMFRGWAEEFEAWWLSLSEEEREDADYLISVEEFAEKKALEWLGERKPAGTVVYTVAELFVDESNGQNCAEAHAFPTAAEAEAFIKEGIGQVRDGIFYGKADEELCDGEPLEDNIFPTSVNLWDGSGNRYEATITKQTI